MLLSQQAGLFLEGVFRVVARIAGQLAIFQFDDFIRHHIQQVAVVRDDDDGALVVADEFLQEGFARQVEMVVGFVQQQQVGLSDQQPGQPRQLALPPAQGLHRQVEIRFGKTQAAQGDAHAALEARPAQLLEFLQQVGLLVERAGEGLFVTIDGRVGQPFFHTSKVRL